MMLVGQHGRRNFKHLQQMRDRFVKAGTGCRIGQLANVLRNKRFVTARQAHRVLCRTTDSQDWRPGMQELHCPGRITPGAADQLKTAVTCIGDTVVATSHHITVINQKRIGDS